MQRRVIKVALLCLCAGQAWLNAQDFKVFDHTVQVHGFVSQGFVYTGDNNWLTMNTRQGSGAITDFGVNMSTPVTDKLRVGAQVYDRNLGQLGQYHPSVDWAVADYRFTSWLGIRGGKVKTTLGLYTDTQDQDFLRTFALLPQSVYPTDLRDATIAHWGGDVYGNAPLNRGFGDLSYTAYIGHRSDSIYSGYPYSLSQFGEAFKSFGGLQYGVDLRWTPPVKGLLIGASRMNEEITGTGTGINLVDPQTGPGPLNEFSKADWTNQYYGEYVVGKLRVDAEYRRYLRDQIILNGTSENIVDVRGWYISGAYRICKKLAVGSYYSHYTVTSILGGALAELQIAQGSDPNQTDTSQPENHIYDKVISTRVDLNRYWNVKIEGHFMNGYGNAPYPDSFYPQGNPNGFNPGTNALILKTGVNF